MNFLEFSQSMRKAGFSEATIDYYGRKLFEEQYGKNKNLYTDEQRKWAYDRGFTAEEVRILGLTEDNYRDYLSSYDYHILDPIDPFTKRLVDGKLVIPYTIGGKFKEYLPEYYCWIFDKSTLIPMNDNPIETWDSIEDYLKKLLKIKKILAIKPYTGGCGVGFVKLEEIEGKYYTNGEIVDDWNSVISMIYDKYVVTEYVRQCDEFNEVCPDSASTLRVITISRGNIQKTFISYVRFGTKVSKGVCNWSAGGVAVPFDWDTGMYKDGFYRQMKYCNGKELITNKHPDSHADILGKKVPHFEEVKKLVNDICSFLKVHTYFGFDIMITNNGVKICEINSHPSMSYEQLMFGGVWKMDKFVTDFFKEQLDKKKNK